LAGLWRGWTARTVRVHSDPTRWPYVCGERDHIDRGVFCTAGESGSRDELGIGPRYLDGQVALQILPENESRTVAGLGRKWERVGGRRSACGARRQTGWKLCVILRRVESSVPARAREPAILGHRTSSSSPVPSQPRDGDAAHGIRRWNIWTPAVSRRCARPREPHRAFGAIPVPRLTVRTEYARRKQWVGRPTSAASFTRRVELRAFARVRCMRRALWRPPLPHCFWCERRSRGLR
jgi:hypothetical protein